MRFIMALRNIVKIDENKCNGCGLCAKACAEGAIKIINGKAKLVSETYCDGLGACLGHCPQDAITIEQREAKPFDENAVKAHVSKSPQFVCPGMATLKLTPQEDAVEMTGDVSSQLTNWPVQLKLISPHAPYFTGADLLLVADCVPFAMGDFHNRFLKGRSIVIGCPKLDDASFYVDKFADILRLNKIRSLTVIHMEVPCCSGITHIAQKALAQAGQKTAFKDITISLQGTIKSTEMVSAE
jgi:Pyruvate/2-oxoacid:ferredoxin oxidoreductase delta subunit